MNHFTIEISKRLQFLGIEGETEWVWKELYKKLQAGVGEPPPKWRVSLRSIHAKDYDGVLLPAYQLHDIIRLMPQIEKAFKWDQPIWECHKGTCDSKFCEYAGQKSIREVAENLHGWFMSGDYPKAEEYLLSILKK